jgi:prepilin-type processing-associated H-X9-DG protein
VAYPYYILNWYNDPSTRSWCAPHNEGANYVFADGHVKWLNIKNNLEYFQGDGMGWYNQKHWNPFL